MSIVEERIVMSKQDLNKSIGYTFKKLILKCDYCDNIFYETFAVDNKYELPIFSEEFPRIKYCPYCNRKITYSKPNNKYWKRKK